MAAIQRLREDVAELAHAEGRKPGTLGHRRVEHYLHERLLTIGLSPYRGDSFRLPFDMPEALHRGGVREGMNLVAVARGTDRAAAPLLLGAHYDSLLEAPCADDNAAAVAIVLEVALELVARPLTRDVVVALFDTEEQPFAGTSGMGSIHFHDHQMDSRGMACAVIQDLTGHKVTWRSGDKKRRLPRVAGLLFMTGAESHADLAGAVAACRRPRRLPLIAVLNRYIGDVSDHRPFRRAGKPYLFFSCGRWEHYHQESDTPQRLNYRKMRRIARFLTTLLARLDALRFAVDQEPVDTTAFEISSLRAAFGPWLPLVRRAMKLGRIESREDLDRIANLLLKTGL